MGKIDQLDEGPRKASRFLSYYCFEKEYISYMVDDMMMMQYMHNYDREKCEKLLNDILDDPALVEKMRDAIAYDFVEFKKLGPDVKEAVLWSLMPQAKIQENLNNTGYLDRDAIRAWYYHMYPKFTPTEVIKHHQNLLENIGREWYNKLEGYSKNQAQDYIDIAYELHNFDFDKVDDMVKELNGNLLVNIDENVIPQVSRGLLQTRHKGRAELLQKVRNKEQRDKSPLSKRLIEENYDYVAKKKFYKKMQIVPQELVARRLSYKYCHRYSVAEVRASVRSYYAERFRYRKQQEGRVNAAEPAIVPQIVVDDDNPVNCSSDLGRHNTLYIPKPVDDVQPTPTVASEDITAKRKAQLQRGRTILKEAINVAMVTHSSKKGSGNIVEASEKIADIACSLLERRYVLVGPPLGPTEKEEFMQSPHPKVNLVRSPTARLNPRWNAPEGVKSTEPTKAATQSTPEKVKTNLPQEPTETKSPTKRLQPRWHPPKSPSKATDTKSPSKATDTKSPKKYDIKSPHKTSDIKSPPKTADTKPAEPTEKKSPTQPSPRRQRLLIPGRTPQKQTETKPSPSRPQPMRRLSSLTPPEATEPSTSPPKSTETRKLGHPMRRLSRMTPPEATEPGPSPKSTSSPPKPTDSKSSPKATKRSFISTDKEDSDHQPKKTRLPSDDSDD